MVFKFLHYKKVKSTNSVAIKKIKQNVKSGVIIADNQTCGRGQFGKKWISYPGNIFLSIFFSVHNGISLKKINTLNCLIIKKAILKFIKIKISIKKPNDLLINKKKFAGILQETITKDNKKFLIVGIGINLIKSPTIKNYQTTNIFKETKTHIPKIKLIRNILIQFKINLKKFAMHA